MIEEENLYIYGMNVRTIYKVLFFCFLLQLSNAQNHAIPNWGGQIGMLCSFGSHTNRLGLMSRFYFQYDFVQLNIQAAVFHNFKSLGSEAKGWEGQLSLGAGGCWGKKRDSIDQINPFLNAVSNQSARPNSAAYSYIFYIDGMGTTQNSGAFGLQIYDFRFFFENDFLGFQSMDKYRSGAFAFFYRWNDWQFGLKSISYTGDPYEQYCPWIEDEVFPSRSGFIDMTSAPLGNKSIGILALQAERRIKPTAYFNLNRQLPLDQYIGAEIGLDAEQIRNFFQNKLIHDSKVLPLNWGDVKNPHIPMLSEDGCPFLYHAGQKIRKPKFYFQGWTNNSILY